jgi:hypothetical protein
MGHLEVRSSRRSLQYAAFAILFLATPLALGQGRRANEGERLNAAKPEENDKKILDRLAKGTEEYTDANKTLVDKAAQWFIYRMTHKEFQFKSNAEAGGDPSTMKTLVDDVSKYIVVANAQKPMSDNQRKFTKAFADALVRHIKKVLVNPVPIARVNAAIVLAKLGDTGLEDVAAHFCDVLENKDLPEGAAYDDAVKLYALIGMKNLFKAQMFKDTKKFSSEDLEQRCIEDLVKFLARKPTFGANAAADEVEAFRYIRREAIRALGWIQVPVTVKNANVMAMPAIELARIIANPESLTPSASLAEQLEAAIGLCKLKNKRSPDRNPYQQEYAAFHIAHFIVNFGTQADQERANASSTMDWKYSAYRLNEALAEMLADSLGRSPYTKEMVGRSTVVVKSIQEGKGVDLSPLNDFVVSKKPTVMEMFKGVPSTAINAAQPSAEK